MLQKACCYKEYEIAFAKQMLPNTVILTNACDKPNDLKI